MPRRAARVELHQTGYYIVVMQQRVEFSLPQIVFRRRPPVSYQLCIVRSSLTQQSRAGERCEFDPTHP